MDPEGHPIPQDITGFQFRLIGDMTVKQFAYLAGGAVAAWLIFSSPLPIIIKLPLAGGFGLLGVILAFMPIHGRPADLMLMLFFKSLFKANQFTFKKAVEETKVTNETKEINDVNFQKTQDTQRSQTISPPAGGSEEQKVNPTILKSDNQTLRQSDAPDLPSFPSVPKTAPAIAPTPNITPQISTQPPVTPSSSQPLPAPQPTTPPAMQSNPIQQPTPINKLPSVPPDAINLIAGVVEDPRGNVLHNILVEVTDTAGSPVRAFKTNQMGQFIAATPLEKGAYTITLEDPDKRHQFPTLKITAKGEFLQPLEVKSMDQREQLRQSLFNPTEVPPIQNK